MTQYDFYRSRLWKNARKAFIQYRQAIDGGICTRCKEYAGYIVHHRQHLDDDSCNDMDVAIGFDNLDYLCLICHNKVHSNRQEHRYRVGDNGEILPFN